MPPIRGEMERHSPLLRFGRFEADASSGELRKDGRVLRVQEQPFQILLMLLYNQGRVVTREELREKLWPADTFVDFDHSLNTAINKLREILGDSATNSIFIQTLARRGYRFMVPVEMTGAALPQPASPAPAKDVVSSAAAAATDDQAMEAGPGFNTHIVLTSPEELPEASRSTVRLLLIAVQTMYLTFYLVALWKLHVISALLTPLSSGLQSAVLTTVVCTAMVCVPIRLYLMTAVLFDYPRLAHKFGRLFMPLFLLDELWALAPLLLIHKLGVGLALAACAALIYLPFAQRSLVLMGYSRLPVRAC